MSTFGKLSLVIIAVAGLLEITLGCQLMKAAFEPDLLRPGALKALPNGESLATLGYFFPVIAGLLFICSYTMGLDRPLPLVLAGASCLALATAALTVAGDDRGTFCTALLTGAWGAAALLGYALKRQRALRQV